MRVIQAKARSYKGPKLTKEELSASKDIIEACKKVIEAHKLDEDSIEKVFDFIEDADQWADILSACK